MVVFENEHFVAADKPALWLTTPAREADDPRPCLGRTLQDQLKQRLYPVHRLDFEVSGLVLFAKTPEAHRDSQAWFEHARVDKLYEALTRPTHLKPPLEWQEWRALLVRGKRRSFEAPHGKEAVTRARVVDAADPWRWELVPVTGRPHQLRVALAKFGTPILGDTLYGGALAAETQKGIALRAVELGFSRVSARFGLPDVLRVDALKW